MLDTARRVNHSTIGLLHQQLDAIRRLDRQLGAIVVRDELKTKIIQVQSLTAHSLAPGTREPLAALLSEMHTLAGWQALDLGDIIDSWHHYEHSRAAAAQSDSIPYESHAAAEQAFVLIDAGATKDAVELLDHARRCAETTASRILRSWLAAAYGEALAAHGDQTASLHAFDHAADLLPDDPSDERPYVALDPVHLARWRGHALARFGDPEATAVLTSALTVTSWTHRSCAPAQRSVSTWRLPSRPPARWTRHAPTPTRQYDSPHKSALHANAAASRDS